METGYKSLAEILKMTEVLPKVGGGGIKTFIQNFKQTEQIKSIALL